jgi:hypothetical protein
MGFQTLSHSNANALQQNILLEILGKKSARADGGSAPQPMDARAKCEMIRTWIELEFLKRELRGIPRLKPTEVGCSMKRAQQAAQKVLAEPIEV